MNKPALLRAYVFSNCWARANSGSWPALIMMDAFSTLIHAPLSASGMEINFRDRGGHSIWMWLDVIPCAGSYAPANAHAWIIFPLLSLTDPNVWKGSVGSIPVSSLNSRFAASSSSSVDSVSPLGMVQAPSSFFYQKGPPGWTRKNSSSTCSVRYINRPADC